MVLLCAFLGLMPPATDDREAPQGTAAAGTLSGRPFLAQAHDRQGQKSGPEKPFHDEVLPCCGACKRGHPPARAALNFLSNHSPRASAMPVENSTIFRMGDSAIRLYDTCASAVGNALHPQSDRAIPTARTGIRGARLKSVSRHAARGTFAGDNGKRESRLNRRNIFSILDDRADSASHGPSRRPKGS
jgi:hypothetical protein